MAEREQLRRSWIANAAAWCEAVRGDRIESRRLVTNAAIVDAVLAQSPRTVLDAGCGEGWLARALAARGVTVTGIDASPPLVEAARSRGGGEFLAIGYEELLANPAAAGSGFDAIVANFSLFEEDMDDLLRAFASILAPEGALIVQTVHPVFASAGADYADGWRTETFARFEGEWREPMPWYFRTLASWVRALSDAGFRVAEIREPAYPDRAVPASIVFVCRKERA